MTDRNYDYLPDDCDALKFEVAALEARVREMQAERGEAIAAAVKKERAEIVAALRAVADKANCDTEDVLEYLVELVRSRP